MPFKTYYRKNKFNAKSCIYNGRTYHSRAEANYAAELDLKKKAGDIADWKPQIRVPLIVYGKKIATYILDFEITHHDGSKELIEVKGFQTNLWRIKWKLFQAIYEHDYPEVKITLVYV